MTVAPTFIVCILTSLLQAGLSAPPVIEAGRDAEIEALFGAVGTGEMKGWSTPDIAIPRDRIRACFKGPRSESVVLEFRYRSGDEDAVAHNEDFEVHLIETSGIDLDEAEAFADRVVRSMPRWKWSATSSISVTPKWHVSAAIANAGWLVALISLLVIVGIVIGRRKPWRRTETLRVMIEMAALFVAALLIRQFLVAAGPGNLYSYVPIPTSPPGEFSLFGPGYSAWMLGWFAILGASDSVAFFAGAFAGAITVIPVYLLAWMGGGKRSWGLAAGIAIALWPIHARLSPTDDPAGLIALLVVSSLALVVAAERTGSSALLIGAWLAGALAATVRPEPALSLLAMGGLVATLPVVRRRQLRLHVLAITVAILAACGLVLVFTVTRASSTFSPLDSLTIEFLKRLLGKQGGSILVPPRTHLLLLLLFILGFGVAARATRGRAVLWFCAGLFPAVPTAILALPDIITARYQMQLVPVAAVLAGIGVVWLGSTMAERVPRLKRWLLPVAAAIPIAVAGGPLVSPAPESTFRLEYAFFREHIKEVPDGSKIVRVRWNVDLGLGPPTHLSGLLDLDHTWIEPSGDLDVESGCLVYWQPASCRVKAPATLSDGRYLLPDCRLIESSYGLEPIARTFLPARTVFVDEYAVDPVPVGFYRLRSRADPEPDESQENPGEFELFPGSSAL